MSPSLYPSPPPEPPFPEFISGMVPEQMRKLMGQRRYQAAKARKQWVKSMTSPQLMAYMSENLGVPSPPGSINRMVLEGVVNWVEGFKRGIMG